MQSTITTQRPPLLTAETLTEYLIEKDLVDSHSVVDTPSTLYQLLDYSRRNRVFKVITPAGEGLLVKQAMKLDVGDYAASIRVEARLLDAVANDAAFADIKWFSPTFVWYDEPSAILVTKLIHPATTISRDNMNLGEVCFQEDSAVTSGRLLANFHRTMTAALRRGLIPDIPRGEPFVFFDSKRLEDLPRSDENQRAFRDLAIHAPWIRDIATTKAAWETHRTVIHRDPRWDNFLLTHGSAPGNNMNMRLIDWELVCVGDEAWDVAYYLAEYVRFWLINSPKSARARTVAQLNENAQFALDTCKPAARAFFEAYCRRARIQGAPRTDLIKRMKLLLPFNLTLIAAELVPHAARMPWVIPVVREMANCAHEDPARAMDQWFGVSK